MKSSQVHHIEDAFVSLKFILLFIQLPPACIGVVFFCISLNARSWTHHGRSFPEKMS